jgi:lipoprotein signal peptidase
MRAALLGMSALVVIDQLAKHLLPTTPGSLRLAPFLGATVLIGGFYLLYEGNLRRFASLGIATILAGGVSNLIDYLIYGSIRDNLRVDRLEFNPADIYIVAGIVILILEALRSRESIKVANHIQS